LGLRDQDAGCTAQEDKIKFAVAARQNVVIRVSVLRDFHIASSDNAKPAAHPATRPQN
jgi:hypothetical protein